MKQKPEIQKIQENMQPGAFSAEGFLGDDSRNLVDILREDDEIVQKLGYQHQDIAARMRELTKIAVPGLGRPTDAGIGMVSSEDHRGKIPCPFRDRYYADKRNTQFVSNKDGTTIYWTDLHIHMIEAHGFYEGKGSRFRLDPEILIRYLFEA